MHHVYCIWYNIQIRTSIYIVDFLLVFFLLLFHFDLNVCEICQSSYSRDRVKVWNHNMYTECVLMYRIERAQKKMEQTTMRFNLNSIDSNFQYIAACTMYIRFDYSSVGRVIASNGLHRVIISVYATQSLLAGLLACLPFAHFTVTICFLFVVSFCSSFGNLFKVTHSLPIKYVCFIIYSVSLRSDERCHQIFIY